MFKNNLNTPHEKKAESRLKKRQFSPLLYVISFLLFRTS
nr:MAG TPA: hypothetical protein [Caudoviricetes sp.]DAX28634.1 MAG TPA: hypothetical protein [Caudoviricetes sp.]